MAEKHKFRIIHSYEDEVYRIIDLTDPTIVGITEMYENDDEYDRESRADYIHQLAEKRILGARIIGYGIFIFPDDDNTLAETEANRRYYQSVLKQMATYFAEEVISKCPGEFSQFEIPKRQRTQPKPKQEKKSRSYSKRFQLLENRDDGLLRIVKEDNPAIVGVVEMFFTNDKEQRAEAIQKHNRIKVKEEVSAKVPNYGIFINLDSSLSQLDGIDNQTLPLALREMADFFASEVIDASPSKYMDYYIPRGSRTTTYSHDRETAIAPCNDGDLKAAPISDSFEIKPIRNKSREWLLPISLIVFVLFVVLIVSYWESLWLILLILLALLIII